VQIMTPLEFILLTFVVCLAAGVLGALLGLGGGVIVVPALTLLLGIHIRYAIGASIVSVIATSSGAAAPYLKQRIANIRLGMSLEVATTIGAVSGAYLAGIVAEHWLHLLFAGLLIYTAVAMFLNRREDRSDLPAHGDRLADRLALHGEYYDRALQKRVAYRVSRTPFGLGLSYVAGAVSGLLGIGGGVLKVPALNLALRVPMKAATATSNFMIGVTAVASAGVYFIRRDIDPFVAAPVVLGVALGAMVGSRLMERVHASRLRVLFVAVLIFLAVEMLMKGLR
jgi:uncharacterized membrane protein YfcA